MSEQLVDPNELNAHTAASESLIDSIIAPIDEEFFNFPSDEEVVKTLVEELYTVQDVVRYLVSMFSMHGVYVGHGTDNYWDEADIRRVSYN